MKLSWIGCILIYNFNHIKRSERFGFWSFFVLRGILHFVLSKDLRFSSDMKVFHEIRTMYKKEIEEKAHMCILHEKGFVDTCHDIVKLQKEIREGVKNECNKQKR